MLPRKHGKTQHIEIVAKGIEEAIGKWNTLVCARCGRQKILANIKHTRLYGIMCVCGSQEWKAAEHGVEADVLPCGHSAGIIFGESSWVCGECGQPVRRLCPNRWADAALTRKAGGLVSPMGRA